jgi:hypothetical protein
MMRYRILLKFTECAAQRSAWSPHRAILRQNVHMARGATSSYVLDQHCLRCLYKLGLNIYNYSFRNFKNEIPPRKQLDLYMFNYYWVSSICIDIPWLTSLHNALDTAVLDHKGVLTIQISISIWHIHNIIIDQNHAINMCVTLVL